MADEYLGKFRKARKSLDNRIVALASGDSETEAARAIHKACTRARDRLYDLARFVETEADREACCAEISEVTRAIIAADDHGFEARQRRRYAEVAALRIEIARKGNKRPY